MRRKEPLVSTIYDLIIENGIATKEELGLVTLIAGYTEQVLADVVYHRTGYKDIFDYLEGEYNYSRQEFYEN